MTKELTDKEALGIMQAYYREHGYCVIACRFPREVGEVLEDLVDEFLQAYRMKILGPATYDEIMEQCRGECHVDLSMYRNLYRVEVLD